MNDQNQSAKVNVSAKTVDEAITEGLAQLNARREQVTITVLKEGRRGVFGIGAEEAQVELRLRPSAEPVVPNPTPQPPVAVKEETPPAPSPVEAPEVEQSDDVEFDDGNHEDDFEHGPTEPIGDAEFEAHTVSYVQELLACMGVEGTVTLRVGEDLAEPNEEVPIVVDIKGKDLGMLIGRRNSTLRALQYIVRLAVNKNTDNRRPILIDVESYRLRRRHSLQQLAEQMAERVAKTRSKVVLEAMPAYERRIIHVALRHHAQVITRSVGSSDERKVTILPKKS